VGTRPARRLFGWSPPPRSGLGRSLSASRRAASAIVNADQAGPTTLTGLGLRRKDRQVFKVKFVSFVNGSFRL